MKKKLFLFIGGFIVINLIFSFAFFRYSDYNKNKRYRHELKFNESRQDIDYLFLGYSRTNRAINTSLIPGSAKFIGGGETTPYIYYRLKYILESSDKNIKCLVLPGELNFAGFLPNQLYVNAIYWQKYFNFLDFAKNSDDFFEYIQIAIKIKLFPYNQYPFAKMTAFDNRADRDTIPKTEKVKYFFSDLDPAKRKEITDILIKKHSAKQELATETGVYYLQKLIDLAEEYEIPIVFLKYPLTRYYYETMLDKTMGMGYSEQDLDSIISVNRQNVQIDFVNLYQDKLDYFYDPHHLNVDGMTEFSNLINDTLQQLNILESYSD